MGLFGCRLTVLGIDRQGIAQSSFMDFTPAVGLAVLSCSLLLLWDKNCACNLSELA